MAEMMTTHDAQYGLDIVKAICAQVGPGMPGTAQERARAMMLKEELKTHLGVANVAVEEFSVAPWASLSSYPFSALFLLIAAILNRSIGAIPGAFDGVSPWMLATAGLLFSLIAPLPFILLFYRNRELLDPFFPKKPSENVIGTLRGPGTQDIQRLLILSGHHDSAPENTWLRFVGYGFLILNAAWMLAFIAMPVLSILQVVGSITGDAAVLQAGTLEWVLLSFPILPAILYGMFFNRGRKNGGNVPGAADNLSASALVVAACRFLIEHPGVIPAGTEIRFISFGSEEAGLRGSRQYVARHLEELRHLNTRMLNFETVVDPEIVILTSDINGTVPNSPEMVDSVISAAKRAGVPYRATPAFLGAGSDAGAFSEAGLKAANLLPFKIPKHMLAFYHTKRDTPEVLTLEPLLNVLKLTLEWIRCNGE